MRHRLLLHNAIYSRCRRVGEACAAALRGTPEDRPFGGAVVGLVNVMAQHGHIDDAIAYLRDPLPGDRFPYILSTTWSGNAAMMRPDGNSWNWPSASGETPLLAKRS